MRDRNCATIVSLFRHLNREGLCSTPSTERSSRLKTGSAGFEEGKAFKVSGNDRAGSTPRVMKPQPTNIGIQGLYVIKYALIAVATKSDCIMNAERVCRKKLNRGTLFSMKSCLTHHLMETIILNCITEAPASSTVRTCGWPRGNKPGI